MKEGWLLWIFFFAMAHWFFFSQQGGPDGWAGSEIVAINPSKLSNKHSIYMYVIIYTYFCNLGSTMMISKVKSH